MPVKDLGTKHTCFKCSTKFYDLKKPVPLCPKCGADQRESPALKAPPPDKRPRPAARKPEPVLDPVETDEDAPLDDGEEDIAEDDE
ncbi:MAG TPA: FYDLN acid domain-containing protein [Anaeromyxobacteraceae bacterium]|nr:FYDLN acid domain-containing protein [Anaeromyxobacteraceae bacterium]